MNSSRRGPSVSPTESRDEATGELQGLVVVQRKDGRGTAVLGGFVEVGASNNACLYLHPGEGRDMHPARVFTGETVEDTVAREVKEETQGTVSNLRLLGVSGHAEERSFHSWWRRS